MGEPILGGFVRIQPDSLPYQCGDAIGFTLLSDLHIGASHVDYKLIAAEIREAAENNDRVLINGDVFDLILPKDHKRFSPDTIHPRLHGRTDLVNGAVEWAADILEPVAHQIDLIGCGNHETALERHHSTDPIKLLIYELERRLHVKGTPRLIPHGGYCGFVDYRFRYRSRSGNEPRSAGKRWVVYYHHGSGGAAPVTKGMIDFNRKDTFVDADLIWMGHKHNRWAGAVQKLSCPMDGDGPTVKEVRHVMTGAYFKTYVGQSQDSIRKHGRRSNYAADAGLAPQGMGGARVVLHFPNKNSLPFQVRVIQ